MWSEPSPCLRRCRGSPVPAPGVWAQLGSPCAQQDKPQEDIESKVKLYFTVIFLLYTKNYSTCSGSTWAGQPSFLYKFHIHSQQSKGSKMKVINGPRLSPLSLLKIIYMLEICRFFSPALASLLRTNRRVPSRADHPSVPHAVLAPTPAEPVGEPLPLPPHRQQTSVGAEHSMGLLRPRCAPLRSPSKPPAHSFSATYTTAGAGVTPPHVSLSIPGQQGRGSRQVGPPSPGPPA